MVRKIMPFWLWHCNVTDYLSKLASQEFPTSDGFKKDIYLQACALLPCLPPTFISMITMKDKKQKLTHLKNTQEMLNSRNTTFPKAPDKGLTT